MRYERVCYLVMTLTLCPGQALPALPQPQEWAVASVYFFAKFRRKCRPIWSSLLSHVIIPLLFDTHI